MRQKQLQPGHAHASRGDVLLSNQPVGVAGHDAGHGLAEVCHASDLPKTRRLRNQSILQVSYMIPMGLLKTYHNNGPRLVKSKQDLPASLLSP